jgi:hypothetical protein
MAHNADPDWPDLQVTVEIRYPRQYGSPHFHHLLRNVGPTSDHPARTLVERTWCALASVIVLQECMYIINVNYASQCAY